MLISTSHLSLAGSARVTLKQGVPVLRWEPGLSRAERGEEPRAVLRVVRNTAPRARIDVDAHEGENLSQFFALPINSESPQYDVYRIKPKAPTEVFVNTVAPTSEQGGQVTKPGGARPPDAGKRPDEAGSVAVSDAAYTGPGSGAEGSLRSVQHLRSRHVRVH